MIVSSSFGKIFLPKSLNAISEPLIYVLKLFLIFSWVFSSFTTFLKEVLDSFIFLKALYFTSSTFFIALNNISFPKLKALDLGGIFFSVILLFKFGITDLLIFCLLLKNFSFS